MATGKREATRRTLRQYMEMILQAGPDGESGGAPAEGDVNNAAAACRALLEKALNGDVRAFCVIRELVGEDGDGRAEDSLEKVRELLGGVKGGF